MTERPVLVTGANGNTGSFAITNLLDRNVKVRAFVQTNDERASRLRSRGVEVAVGDLTDINDVRAALEGVGAAYFVYPIQPGLIEAGAYFAQAAQEAGVSAIVNMSQISARREAKSHAALNHTERRSRRRNDTHHITLPRNQRSQTYWGSRSKQSEIYGKPRESGTRCRWSDTFAPGKTIHVKVSDPHMLVCDQQW